MYVGSSYLCAAVSGPLQFEDLLFEVIRRRSLAVGKSIFWSGYRGGETFHLFLVWDVDIRISLPSLTLDLVSSLGYLNIHMP